MIGENVASHRIVSRLGRTGLGELWRVEDSAGGAAALLMLPPGAVSFTATSVEHLHLARVRESGVHDNGRPYLVLDPVRGESLAELVAREGRLSTSIVADVAGKIATALDALHAHGHVHRGLSTAGIYIDQRPDDAHVTVFDAGLATDVVKGIGGYAAPEAWIPDGPVDARTDIYALGCIAFEMASGRTPFVGSTHAELPDRHRNAQVASLASLVPDVTKALDMLVSRMLQKRADDRPRAAKELSFVFELVENNEVVPSLGSTMKHHD